MLTIPQRVELWHRALGAIRAYFTAQGLREVSTPVRLEEVALEPFIEPIESMGCYLATSPELPMKQLLARGSGPIFQIAPVFRAGESGSQHAPEFRLVEWYRLDDDPRCVRADVEGLVASVVDAVGDLAGGPRALPRWETHRWLDVFEATTGVRLGGDESAQELERRLSGSRDALWEPPPGLARLASDEARTLLAWTAVFTTWSDRFVTGWLAARSGVHLIDFPEALAALSRLRGDGTSLRFESHVGALELANGYAELTDAKEQAQRFAAVAALRTAMGAPALPHPRVFIEVLDDPGLPPCSGAALGLDRLLMWVTQASTLRAVTP